MTESEECLLMLCRCDQEGKPMPPGGQHVGVIPRGIRITHVNSGIFAFCNTEYSARKNRSVALAMIEYGLAEIGWDWREEHARWANEQMAALCKASNEGSGW